MSVTSEPNLQSLSILQLKQGDPVEVLEKKDGFVKIRFKIDGDFPVEGWLPEAALSQTDATTSTTAERQPYEMVPKSPVETEVKEFPNAPLTESVQTQMKAKDLKAENREAALGPREIHRRKPGPWLFETQYLFGYQSWNESIKTKKEDTQTYGDSPFLQYDMSGVLLGAQFKASYDFQMWEVGGFVSYSLTFFRGSVPATTQTYRPGIDQGNVQALMHDFQLAPFVRYPFKFGSQWILIPELRLISSFNLFSTNQLKSTDNVNPGVLGQSVLYSFSSVRADAEFAPELKMPFNLSLTPKIGVSLFNWFTESPVTDVFRTGEPDGTGFNLSYGAKLTWNLKSYDWETLNLVASYSMKDYSKNYKGQGNRAGLKTIDAKSTAHSTLIGLGAEYLF